MFFLINFPSLWHVFIKHFLWHQFWPSPPGRLAVTTIRRRLFECFWNAIGKVKTSQCKIAQFKSLPLIFTETIKRRKIFKKKEESRGVFAQNQRVTVLTSESATISLQPVLLGSQIFALICFHSSETFMCRPSFTQSSKGEVKWGPVFLAGGMCSCSKGGFFFFPPGTTISSSACHFITTLYL